MIKICGIRRKEDICHINRFPPDFMGMILSQGFKRTVPVSEAAEFLKELAPEIKRVGVFVDEAQENIARIAGELSLDAVQLHGSEDKAYIDGLRTMLPENVMLWKAVRVREKEDILKADGFGCDMLVLDSFVKGAAGGTGKVADWDIIRNTDIKTPFFLAGGISAENIAQALEITPHIDLSGSVETDGFKDGDKIQKVISIYNNTERNNHNG